MVFKFKARKRVNAVFLALVCYRIIKEQQVAIREMEDAVVGSVRRMSRRSWIWCRRCEEISMQLKMLDATTITITLNYTYVLLSTITTKILPHM